MSIEREPVGEERVEEERKKEVFGMLGRDCLGRGVSEASKTGCLGLEGFPKQAVRSVAIKQENQYVAGLQKAHGALWLFV